MERRTILLKWVPPFVAAVALPVHAQTSLMCAIADVAGEWEFTVNGNASNITLNADGTTPSNGIWIVFGDNQINLTFNSGEAPTTYLGSLSQSCNTMSGNLTLPDNTMSSFSARKL